MNYISFIYLFIISLSCISLLVNYISIQYISEIHKNQKPPVFHSSFSYDKTPISKNTMNFWDCIDDKMEYVPSPLLSRKQIMKLHQKFIIKPPSYFEEMTNFIELWNKMGWDKKRYGLSRHGAARFGSYVDFHRWSKKYKLHHCHKLLGFYPDDPIFLNELLTYDKAVWAIYNPNTEENDLHSLNLTERDFDCVVMSNTLEHVYDINRVLRRIYCHMKPGAWFFTDSPILNVPHLIPFNFINLMPWGLVSTFVRMGFEINEIGYWGTADYIHYLYSKNSWPDHYKLSQYSQESGDPGGNIPTLHSAVHYWILVRKPKHPYQWDFNRWIESL